LSTDKKGHNLAGVLKSTPANLISLLLLTGRNLGITALAIGVVLIFLESVVRKLFNYSLIITNEVGSIINVVLVFLCIGWVYQQKAHLRASFIIDRFPKRVRKYWEIMLTIVTLAGVGFIMYLWWDMTILSIENKMKYRMSHIAQWPFRVVGMVGWSLLFLAIIQDLTSQIRQLFKKCRSDG